MGWLVQGILEKIRCSLSKYPSATIETKKCENMGKIYIFLTFFKTLPLGFAWLQASPVSKKVGGLPSRSVQLDSPGTALTVGGWIRPMGQN